MKKSYTLQGMKQVLLRLLGFFQDSLRTVYLRCEVVAVLLQRLQQLIAARGDRTQLTALLQRRVGAQKRPCRQLQSKGDFDHYTRKSNYQELTSFSIASRVHFL